MPQLKQEQEENKTHPVSSRVSRFSGSVTSRQTDPNTTAKPPFIIKMTTCHHTDLLSNTRSRCSSRALQKGTQLFWLYNVGNARSFVDDFLPPKSKTIRPGETKQGLQIICILCLELDGWRGPASIRALNQVQFSWNVQILPLVLVCAVSWAQSLTGNWTVAAAEREPRGFVFLCISACDESWPRYIPKIYNFTSWENDKTRSSQLDKSVIQLTDSWGTDLRRY